MVSRSARLRVGLVASFVLGAASAAAQQPARGRVGYVTTVSYPSAFDGEGNTPQTRETFLKLGLLRERSGTIRSRWPWPPVASRSAPWRWARSSPARAPLASSSMTTPPRPPYRSCPASARRNSWRLRSAPPTPRESRSPFRFPAKAGASPPAATWRTSFGSTASRSPSLRHLAESSSSPRRFETAGGQASREGSRPGAALLRRERSHPGRGRRPVCRSAGSPPAPGLPTFCSTVNFCRDGDRAQAYPGLTPCASQTKASFVGQWQTLLTDWGDQDTRPVNTASVSPPTWTNGVDNFVPPSRSSCLWPSSPRGRGASCSPAAGPGATLHARRIAGPWKTKARSRRARYAPRGAPGASSNCREGNPVLSIFTSFGAEGGRTVFALRGREKSSWTGTRLTASALSLTASVWSSR